MSRDNKPGQGAFGQILAGGLLLFGAFYFNGVFTELESGTSESVRINWIVAALYKLAGHKVTVAIIALVGILVLFKGIKQLATA